MKLHADVVGSDMKCVEFLTQNLGNVGLAGSHGTEEGNEKFVLRLHVWLWRHPHSGSFKFKKKEPTPRDVGSDMPVTNERLGH